MNFIVYDLEATCWQGSPPGLVQEIIEIGAYLVSPYGEVLDEFSRFVRPWRHPNLSAFCQELTTITQHQVDRAEGFPSVIEDFKEWADMYYEEYLLCSWGAFDRKMLANDCRLHKLEYDWTDHHINIKAQYRDLYKLSKPVGLHKAIRRAGLEFEGTQHRAIDDAHNLVRIFTKHLDTWRY